MSKFHINNNGEALRCSAKIKCEFGLSLEEHYETRKGAREAYEASQVDATAPMSIQKQKTPPTSLYMTHDGVKVVDPDDVYNSMDNNLDYTPEAAENAFNERIKNVKFQLKTDRIEEPGILLEKLFGKIADSVSEADLGSVELKTVKGHSAKNRLISLSQMALTTNQNKFKNNYLDRLDTNKVITAGKWTRVGSNYFNMFVDRKHKKVRIVVADRHKNIINAGGDYWDFASFEEKVDKKLENIAVATYEVNGEDKTVNYNEMHLGGFSKESIIDKIESGHIKLEVRKNRDALRLVFKSTLNSIIEGKRE